MNNWRIKKLMTASKWKCLSTLLRFVFVRIAVNTVWYLERYGNCRLKTAWKANVQVFSTHSPSATDYRSKFVAAIRAAIISHCQCRPIPRWSRHRYRRVLDRRVKNDSSISSREPRISDQRRQYARHNSFSLSSRQYGRAFSNGEQPNSATHTCLKAAGSVVSCSGKYKSLLRIYTQTRFTNWANTNHGVHLHVAEYRHAQSIDTWSLMRFDWSFFSSTERIFNGDSLL